MTDALDSFRVIALHDDPVYEADCVCRHRVGLHLSTGRCSWPACSCAWPEVDLRRAYVLALPPTATLGDRRATAAIAFQRFVMMGMAT